MLNKLLNHVWWTPFINSSLTAILLITSIALLAWHLRHHDVIRMNLPPGSSGWPIIGETLAFILDGRKYMSERIERYGPVFRSSLLGKKVIVISGADNVRAILLGEGTTVEVSHPSSVRSLIGPGTLSNTLGPAHNDLHKVISKAFRHSNLREITPLVHQVIRGFVSRWRDVGDVKSGVAEVKKLAFSLGVNVLLGLDFSSSEIDTVMRLFETFNEAFFTFPIDLPGFAYRKGRQARKALIDLIRKHLNDIEYRPHERRVRLMHDLLHRYKSTRALDEDENNGETGANDLSNIALELVFGSHATIASSLCSVLIYLAHQPSAFDTVRHQLDDAKLCHQSDDIIITYDDVMAASSAHHVINEVLRISPPIAGSFRKTKLPIRIAGYDIPQDWSILFSITSTHILSPIYGEDRDDFKPKRWQVNSQCHEEGQGHEDYTTKSHHVNIIDQLKSEGRFHYIPFGAGQRRCVGKEFAKLCLRLFVMEIVRTGRWSLVNGFPEIKTCPFVYPKDNLPLMFERDNHNYMSN